MAQPDRHKHKPIRVRPRETDLLWLLEHSAATGRAVNAIVADAVAAYRAGLCGPTASGPTTVDSGPTTEKRKPQRAQAPEASPPPVAGLVPASSLPPPPPERKPAGQCPPHPKARVLKGLCRACGTYVGTS